MNKTLFFVGGCSGTGSPPSGKISCPSVRTNVPMIEPVVREEFGTLTTSFGILRGEYGIFIDNGGGIQHVAALFLQENVSRVYGLQTHKHFDHRSGIHSNSLLFKKGLVQKLFAPALSGRPFAELLKSDFSGESWPISPEALGISHVVMEFAPGAAIDVESGIKTLSLNHPGGAVAYRIHLPEGDVVVGTDHELLGKEYKEEFARFISGARLLYVDLQYRESEYVGDAGINGGAPMPRKGWGHSTPQMLAQTLTLTDEVPSIILGGHHEPQRPDSDLLAFEEEARKILSPWKCEVRFARELDVVAL